jgi:lysophospholipase L1-like esterase
MSEMHILCYGDSNTYGFNAEDGSRFSADIRWPSVMAQHLGVGKRVIEEGCNGRTIFDVNHIDESLNGTAYFPGCIDRHNPVDLVIIYLGINDLFLSAGMTVRRIAEGLMSLISISEERSKNLEGKPARILIIAPPPVNPAMAYHDYYAREIESSQQFTREYGKVAQMYGCLFLDAGRIIQAMDLDGVHLDSENHKRLGACVASFVQEGFS